MPIRVVALVEAVSVTGPMKNLLAFCRAAQPEGEIELSIAAFVRGEASNPFLDAVREAGVPLDVIRERGRFDRSVIAAIAEILDRRRPHLLQTHAVKSHFLARYGGFARRVAWIAFHHGYTSEDLKMRLYIQLDRWSLRAARRVITVCGPFADELAQTGVRRERIQIIPNAVAPPPPVRAEEIESLRRRFDLSGSSRIVLAIGRFSSEKGHADLLAALAILARDRPDLAPCLLLAGDGIERANLERMAASCGHRVIFAGHQGNVWPFLALADLLVLPSRSEGSPNVLLEAMAAGVPVVATGVGGVPESVENGSSAWLVPPRAPAALAAALAEALDRPDVARQFAANAAARVAAHFSPHIRHQTLLAMYRSAASAAEEAVA